MQGAETLDEDKQRISDAIKAEKDCSVNLLNYKKDGTKFINEVSSLLMGEVKDVHWVVGRSVYKCICLIYYSS